MVILTDVSAPRRGDLQNVLLIVVDRQRGGCVHRAAACSWPQFQQG